LQAPIAGFNREVMRHAWGTENEKGNKIPAPCSPLIYFLIEYARTRFEIVPKIAKNNSAGSIGNINIFNVIGRPGMKNNIGKYAIKKKTI